VTVIALNRLGRNDGAAMVERLAGNAAPLPPDVIAEIVERTDGVPLFVEQLRGRVRGWLRSIVGLGSRW
jgi:predicted ATPase